MITQGSGARIPKRWIFSWRDEQFSVHWFCCRCWRTEYTCIVLPYSVNTAQIAVMRTRKNGALEHYAAMSTPPNAATQMVVPQNYSIVLQSIITTMRNSTTAVEGENGDACTYRLAKRLVYEFRLPYEEAYTVLRAWNETNAIPPWSEAELHHKLTNAIRNKHQSSDIQPYHVPRLLAPKLDDSTKLPVLMNATLNHLTMKSPYSNCRTLSAEELLDVLFPGNPILCLARDKRRPLTAPREIHRGRAHDAELIVPNAMSQLTGLTKTGKTSVRCLDNTGPRQYLVIECDYSPHKDFQLLEHLTAAGRTVHDASASLLLHLAAFAPLVLVVHSGNRSLHGWFPVQDASESVVDTLMAYAVAYGADPATRCRCQFVRMPGGFRWNNRRRQEVLYCNPQLFPKAV